jgi:aspartate dehydrogenase
LRRILRLLAREASGRAWTGGGNGCVHRLSSLTALDAGLGRRDHPGSSGIVPPDARHREETGMIKVGIIGMGVIGTHVARAIDSGIPGIALAGVSVRATAQPGPYPVWNPDELIRRSDLVVEAATQAALLEIGPAVLKAGKHLMVLSVGALIGVLDEWARLAEKHGCRILVPSGAIAGLDGMKGAREGAITSVTMETRKPPRGLAGAPYIVERQIDLDAIDTETLIFEGPATLAVKAFPANVNVVAALSLAGLGPERTRIKLFAVPGQAVNQHRILVEGEFGRLCIEVENIPSENPRTGRLSYLSAIAMLREMGTSVQVGN